MSATPSPSRASSFAALYSAAADWARTDGLTWVYLFKALAACFLALGIAMKLDLPQPRTAMTTVFIVMQPQSGMVFAKSFYRICGTLVGLVVMLALIGLFAQQPELFIVTTAIWVGICTAGAARNRNFKSYGFVLAGYTAALIGIPASQHPDGAFLSALTRVAEVVVGIICAGAVSGLVFPQFAGLQMRSTVRARFSAFVEYVSASLAGRNDRAQIEATNARFVADIVGFEAARSVAVFEGPDSRMRGGRLARLNSEFMTASTRFHALHQLMNRLRDSQTSGAMVAVEALEPYFKEIAPLLAKSGEPVLSATDAAHAAAQLDAYKAELPKRVRETRAALETQPDAPLLDFDTGAELLYRFIDDLHAYAATYASLAVDIHERERWIERYEPKTNGIAAGVAGLRAAIVMVVLGAFWIATAWPSGSTLTLDAAAVCALASASPDPKRTAFQMAAGTLVASVMGMIAVYGVYPHIDGFPLLCAALTPFLLLGVFMTTRPALAGYGVGYCIFFCFLAGPDNLIHYDPSGTINDAIALVLSMLVCAVAFAVLLPPSTPWLRNRLLIDLRRQVALASRVGMRRVRSRFESGARDLMSQINALAQNEPEVKRDTLRWLFAVLEVGNAMIDLRGEVAALPRDARYAKSMPWRVTLRAMRDAVTALFERPRADRFDRALAATTDAIAAVQLMLATFTPPREDRHRLQRILSQLHFIRTALLDPQSPLEPLMSGRADASEGVRHAT
ncbi:p-hydroxybenzoic acid efflux pump subunit AaeB [Paraburkholderia aspalathi]|uniref:p-hydroxybenzoic acid efflux pump subunit AaeB n=1 Tax=Paraburkholderia aspalathi TaxID=1324617 RepID=A0ABN7L618_9BURK|nr:FUSC family protein [Paraburkholderia aspalathi]MBK3818656.1 FUSC family protein [Paraburkholderia aspalathi]MBK3830509.1 FUSC family protein [Paraburkholderia aspalathi]MBK3860210.1 FUSC family protein [Paraburkholderia aspalathi]CAE6730277.1 p-hydroxybenzoic acid efflux pump subunit AaeB [Paraburkholderia aspalathi]